MSLLTVDPQSLVAAAGELRVIGSDIRSAHLAGAAATTSLPAAGGDEVSTAIAELFSANAQEFQKLAANAEQFHDQFVQKLSGSAGAFRGAEAANVSLLSGGVILGNLALDVVTFPIWVPVVIVIGLIVLAFGLSVAVFLITNDPSYLL